MAPDQHELTPEQRALRERVQLSHLQDPQRWTLSYRDHTATMLRRRNRRWRNGRSA